MISGKGLTMLSFEPPFHKSVRGMSMSALSGIVPMRRNQTPPSIIQKVPPLMK